MPNASKHRSRCLDLDMKRLTKDDGEEKNKELRYDEADGDRMQHGPLCSNHCPQPRCSSSTVIVRGISLKTAYLQCLGSTPFLQCSCKSLIVLMRSPVTPIAVTSPPAPAPCIISGLSP